MRFRNSKHATVCKTHIIQNPYRLDNRFLAAVYLLSANRETWLRAKNGIREDRVDFSRIPKTGLTPYQYAIVSAAQDICEDTRHLTLYDIGDMYLMEEDLFDLIINALKICKGGYRMVGVIKQFN